MEKIYFRVQLTVKKIKFLMMNEISTSTVMLREKNSIQYLYRFQCIIDVCGFVYYMNSVLLPKCMQSRQRRRNSDRMIEKAMCISDENALHLETF